MNATNVIPVNFRQRRPAAPVLRPARLLCTHEAIYRVIASMAFAFACGLAHVAYLLTLWL
jgi:hypothetical protein